MDSLYSGVLHDMDDWESTFPCSDRSAKYTS